MGFLTPQIFGWNSLFIEIHGFFVGSDAPICWIRYILFKVRGIGHYELAKSFKNVIFYGGFGHVEIWGSESEGRTHPLYAVPDIVISAYGCGSATFDHANFPVVL